MNEIVKYLLVVIPLLIILEGLLFLINKPKKDTGNGKSACLRSWLISWRR